MASSGWQKAWCTQAPLALAGLASGYRRAGTSLRDWLDAKVRRPRLRRLIDSLAYPLVYTSVFDLVSAEVLVDKLQRALKHPVHYIDGGWRVLVDGLREVAERAGGALLTMPPSLGASGRGRRRREANRYPRAERCHSSAQVRRVEESVSYANGTEQEPGYGTRVRP